MVTTRRSSAAKPDQDDLASTSKPVVEDDLRLHAKRPRGKHTSESPLPSKKRRSLRSNGPVKDPDSADDVTRLLGYEDVNASIDNNVGVDLPIAVYELQEDLVASKSDNDGSPRQTSARKLVRSTQEAHEEKGGPVEGDGGVGNGTSQQDVVIEAQYAPQYDGEASNRCGVTSSTKDSIANAHKRFPSEEPLTQLSLGNVQLEPEALTEPEPETAAVPSLLLDQHIGDNSDSDVPEAMYSKGLSSSAVTPALGPRKRKRKARSKLVGSPELGSQIEAGNDVDQLAVPEFKAPEDFPLQQRPPTELEATTSSTLSPEERKEQKNKRSFSVRVRDPRFVQQQLASGPLAASSTRNLLKSSAKKPLKDTIKDGVIYRPLQKTEFDRSNRRGSWQGSHLPPKSNPSNWRLKKQVTGRKKVQRVWGGRVEFLHT